MEVVDRDLGETRQVGFLIEASKTPAAVRRPAPALDQHDSITGFANGAAPCSQPPPIAIPSPGAPLAGVTVVELAWFYAAPFGLALMADLGARVIKVEGPEGDPHRNQGAVPEWAGVKGLAGKESVVIDYRTPEGAEILHRLVASADMVMCNYRMTNRETSAVTYEHLQEYNPELVYLYATAYGADGPYGSRPAFAPTMGVAAGQHAYQLGWDRALDNAEEITYEEGLRRRETSYPDGTVMTPTPTLPLL